MNDISKEPLRRSNESTDAVELTGEGDELRCCVSALFDSDDGKRNASHVGCTPVLDVSVLALLLDVPLLRARVDFCFVVGVGVLATLLIVLLLAIVGVAVICQ